jgi:hypothetical protein
MGDCALTSAFLKTTWTTRTIRTKPAKILILEPVIEQDFIMPGRHPVSIQYERIDN